MKKDMILHKIGQLIVPLKRTMSPLGGDSHSACSGHFFNRCLLLLFLMLTMGINVAWGQDLSGTYYIASDANNNTYTSTPTSNYYLCPTEGWCYYQATDNYWPSNTTEDNKTMPFLTTYKCRSAAYHSGDASDAVWIIKKAPNSVYYYIIQRSTGKYMVSNGQIDESTNANRMRVHLEFFANEEDLDDKVLFDITPYDFSIQTGDINYVISPKSSDGWNGNSYKWYTVNGGNKDYLKGNGSNGGPTDYTATGGIIGLYTKTDINARFVLEEYIKRPTIAFNSSKLVEITPAQSGTVTIKYTTDGKTPTSEYGKTYSGPFDPPANTATIKAIAIVNGEESNVATFTPAVFFGENHKYLIQSQGNGWTTGNFQGCHYYVIPGDVDNNITKVNTTSMLRPSMQWYFLDAGDDYYYIVNPVANARMRYNTTNGVHMDAWDEDNANEFKFQIVKSATAGTYNIIPYGVTVDSKYLNKAGGNTDVRALVLHNNATDANSRWKFVPQDTPLADTPPFMPSGTSTSAYYTIRNGNGTTFHITPPARADGNATASEATDDATVKSMSWYFIQVDDPTTTDWLTYYKIINAGTGKALYYAYTANNSPCLKVSDYDENNNDYKFAFVKSPTADYYYIVPKSHKDDQLNKISTFYRNSSNILPATTRAASGNVWTFIAADLFCNDPKFVEEEGIIKIKCNTNAAKIYINTESDANPTSESTLYAPSTNEDQNWVTANQVRIKAIASVSDGTNSASSDVVTLLNKPDVTLETGPYIYKAAAWEPAVTLSIGTTQTTTGFSTTYNNNINVGTEANVTITDNNASDVWYIWNVPVTEFTIKKASLTITANNKSIGYGDDPANGGVTYAGFAGSDTEETEGVFGGTLEYSYTTSGDDPHHYTPYDPQYGNQGDYVITPGGLTSTNYDITFISGTMTVTKKSIGDGSLAPGFTLSFDEDNSIILTQAERTLVENTDFSVAIGSVTSKYSSRTVSGEGNYTGSFDIRNAIVHFTSDGSEGATEWSATFVAEKASNTDIGHALPDGITAYIITDINGDWAIPEPLNYIPEGVPVLLLANEEKNGFLVTDANSAEVVPITTDQKGYNMLEEVTDDPSKHFDTREIYLLYNNEFVFNKAGDLAKGKVYLNPNHTAPAIPDPNPARRRSFLKIAWDYNTDIRHLLQDEKTGKQNGIWHAIDGRRLSRKPSAKGLYIMDGKKIFVK